MLLAPPRVSLGVRIILLCLGLLLTACRAGPPTAPASKPASQPAAAHAVRAAEARARLEASRAGRVVLSATEAHGGLDAWFAGEALAFQYDYRPVQGARRASTQTVDLLRSRVYHRFEAPTRGDIAFDGAQAWMRLEGAGSFAGRFWALTPYYFVGMPFVLGDPGVQLTLLDEDPTPAGLSDVDMVKVTFAPGTGDAPGDSYILYISRHTHLVQALRYVVTYAPFFEDKAVKASPEKLLVYDDLAPAGPLTLARRHTFYAFAGRHRGDEVANAEVSDVVYGAHFDEARLAMPEGAVLDSALDP